MKILRNIFVLSSFLILIFGVGYRLGERSVLSGRTAVSASQVTGKESAVAGKSLDFSLFWEVWDTLGKNYIDKAKIDSGKMVYGAISGMVSSLGDPYTVFLPPQENKEVKADLGGQFEGIGAQLGIKDKMIVVIAPLTDSPAEKAGLKAGDWIQKVDGADTMDWTLPEAVAKIRGPKGSQVKLVIIRKEDTKPRELVVVRDAVHVASVEWSMKTVSCLGESCEEKTVPCPACVKVAYLKLSRFGDTTNDEWNKSVDEIVASARANPAMKGLILDVRNNPGGYLTGSIFIGSEFLKDGTIVTQESSSGQKEIFSVNRQGKLLSVPMVVLVNKGSASAAEIVAGALQRRGRAKLVGETTFGKGSIQQSIDLRDGTGLHITTSKWLLPDGVWINGTGITPDVKVEQDENQPDKDFQLEKAYRTLVK